MGSEWQTVSLGDITNITSSKRIFAADYCETGIPFYRSKEVIEKSKGNEISTELFISEEKFNSIKDKFGAPEANDILLTSVGTIGVPYLVRPGEQFYFKDGNLTWLRTSKSEADPKFILIWLKSRVAKQAIDEVTIGSTQQALTIVALKSLPITLPSLPEQKAIAHILSSLDDKIELNRKMNATLEAMARALFKSWFVDFDPVIDNALEAGNPIPEELSPRARLRQGYAGQAELRKNLSAEASAKEEVLALGSLNKTHHHLFPSSFVETETGEWIPEGWRIGQMTELADLNPESWTNKKHPETVSYVDLANTKNGQINETASYEFSAAPSRARRVLRKDDTIIGTVRPANRSYAYVFDEGLTGSTGFAVLRSKTSLTRSFVYLCSTQDKVIKEFAHLADGAAYPAIRPEVVGNIGIPIPDNCIFQAFEDYVSSMMRKIGEHQQANRTLGDIRDTLLPKLISGEKRLCQ